MREKEKRKEEKRSEEENIGRGREREKELISLVPSKKKRTSSISDLCWDIRWRHRLSYTVSIVRCLGLQRWNEVLVSLLWNKWDSQMMKNTGHSKIDRLHQAINIVKSLSMRMTTTTIVLFIFHYCMRKQQNKPIWIVDELKKLRHHLTSNVYRHFLRTSKTTKSVNRFISIKTKDDDDIHSLDDHH